MNLSQITSCILNTEVCVSFQRQLQWVSPLHCLGVSGLHLSIDPQTEHTVHSCWRVYWPFQMGSSSHREASSTYCFVFTPCSLSPFSSSLPFPCSWFRLWRGWWDPPQLNSSPRWSCLQKVRALHTHCYRLRPHTSYIIAFLLRSRVLLPPSTTTCSHTQ